jgi:hypothetical protein
MINFKEIEKRIKSYTGLAESRDIARLFGMTPQNYSNKKSAGSLLPVIIEWAIQENVNLNWILMGEEGPSIIKDNASSDWNRELPRVGALPLAVPPRLDTRTAALSDNFQALNDADKSMIERIVTALINTKK